MRVAIIGAGVNGAALAYFLARSGADDVVVFERDNVGGVTTSKSIGIVRSHYSHRRHIEISRRGREILENFEEHTGQNGGFQQNGLLNMAGPEHEETFREIVAMQKELGLDVTLLEPEDIAEYFPGLVPDGLAVGSMEHEAGYADPYQVTVGFARQAQELGAEVRTKTPVTDLEVSDGTVTAVETENGTEEFDFVVNAAGPYAAEVGAMAGVEIPISWFESKVVILDSEKLYGPDLPSIIDMSYGRSLKPEPGGDFLVGGFDQPIESIDQLEGVGTDEILTVQEYLEARLPDYTDAKFVNDWSGPLSFSPDSHQIVGVPEGYDNFFNLVAGSGHGFKEAGAFAESSAAMILGEQPAFDLSPYRLERFEEGDELTGKYDHSNALGAL
jgi:sarcosine oxidase subunit beta